MRPRGDLDPLDAPIGSAAIATSTGSSSRASGSSSGSCALASDKADEATRFGRAFHLAVSDAADDPMVRPVLRRVAERRIECLIACLRVLGLSADEARQRGLLAYAAYVGTLRPARESPGRLPTGGAHVAYRRHLMTTLDHRITQTPFTLGWGLTPDRIEHMIYSVPERRSADR